MEKKILENFILKDVDVLIIGGGLAGLVSAYEASDEKIKVAIAYTGTGASPRIMGFNAPLSKGDSVSEFYKDILKSGCGINNSKLVSILTENALEIVQHLSSLGVTTSTIRCSISAGWSMRARSMASRSWR